MVFMNFASRIADLQIRVKNEFDLGGLCLIHFQNNLKSYDVESILDSYSGSLERSAAQGYLSVEIDPTKFDEIYAQINNPTIKKSISIFHIIGISLLFQFQNDYRYQALLKDWFDNHSIRVKFLISRFFAEYQSKFLDDLRREGDDILEISLLKNSFFKDSDLTIDYQESVVLNDIIHLIILLEFKQRGLRNYQIEKEELHQAILFASREIQSKHKVFNNNEDQFNSVLQSLLSMNYFVENQSQRGLSSSGKTFGELDLKVFTKSNSYPLSIIEAFVISSIDKSYISKHLLKLTENYDPNGLSRNYAVIYVNNSNFHEIWLRYMDFLKEFEYSIELKDKQITDETNNHPTFSNIKIGRASFNYNGMPIEIYHLFLNMKN
jgi:hypothetical protein